jgi:asparagine synthetase B (glutamine-hydrolysing)
MPGMLGVFTPGTVKLDVEDLIETIDLRHTAQKQHLRIGQTGLLGTAHLAGAPLQGPRLYDDERYAIAFAGDIVNKRSLPWDDWRHQIAAGDISWVVDLRGRFAVAVWDKQEQTVKLYSDRFLLQQIFYLVDNGSFAFSTALPTFVRLPRPPSFDVRWLYGFLYIKYPALGDTFLRQVRRLPAASVLQVDLRSGAYTVCEYIEKMRTAATLMRGQKALDHGLAVFQRRVPAYFTPDHDIEHSLTGGMDARTLIRFGLDHPRLRAYTYGQPGCPDIREAPRTAQTIGLPHLALYLDAAFAEKLPDLAWQTLYLSGGQMWYTRSILPYVFDEITDRGARTPIIISGIALDALFRGHSNARGDMDTFIATGRTEFTDPWYGVIFGEKLGEFQGHVCKATREILRVTGPLDRPEGLHMYHAYVVLPGYFAGEIALADNFGAFRMPGFDADIVRLSFDTEFGTSALSKFAHPDWYKENMMQAYVICSDPRMRRVKARGVPMWMYIGHRNLFRLAQYVRRAPETWVRRRKLVPKPPITDWPQWFSGPLHSQIRSLLNRNSLLAAYVDPDCFDEVLASRNSFWVGNLASTEMILRLLQKRWRL